MKYLSLVALSLLAATAFAADSPREPWKLDDRERAARRADPSLNAIRRAIAVSEGKTRASEETFVVDGSRNPELVMPAELMRAVPVAYDPYFAAKNYREKWERRGAAQLLGDDWWTRLHEAVREYIELDIELTRIGVRMQKADGEDRKALDRKNRELQAGNRLCRMTADSLAAARKAFGRETFDRFLYQCVAPDAFHVTSTSSAQGLADTFLWVEGGCR